MCARRKKVADGTFGALSIAWGLLLRTGRDWARKGAIATTGFLSLVFSWRSVAGREFKPFFESGDRSCEDCWPWSGRI